jgi:hypothetical protein
MNAIAVGAGKQQTFLLIIAKGIHGMGQPGHQLSLSGSLQIPPGHPSIGSGRKEMPGPGRMGEGIHTVAVPGKDSQSGASALHATKVIPEGALLAKTFFRPFPATEARPQSKCLTSTPPAIRIFESMQSFLTVFSPHPTAGGIFNLWFY